MIGPDKWQPADNLVLEPNALVAATEILGCLALTAGPGAGKTEMLAQRADFLLRTGLCRYPKRILAISFKVDASTNLKERVSRRCGMGLSTRFDSHTFHAFAKRLIDRFRPVLSGSNALNRDYTIGDYRVQYTQITFADLVPLAIEVIEKSSLVQNAIRQTYSDLFLDEFQDCTDTQYKLIRLAFGGTNVRLTAVGDTKQKIMGWAGALEGIFLKYAHDFNATALNLYRNFRSQPRLLRMQNEIIKVLDAKSIMPDELISGDSGEISVERFGDSQEEATELAARINDWISSELVSSAEIAVLVSKQPNCYAELLIAELERLDIPFRNEHELQDLSAEPITRLFIDYLLVIFGAREPEAYTRLMRLIIDTSVDDSEQSMVQSKWSSFLNEQRRKAAVSEINFDAVWSFVVTFQREFGKEHIVSLSPDYESAIRLDELIANISTYLRESLQDKADVSAALAALTNMPGVRIMTIHKSKGLEFDSVIVLGVEKETFWGKSQEERCAFFVGISRAKRRLLLTYVGTRQTPSSNPRRWSTIRTPHQEFLSYAIPYVVPPVAVVS